MANKTILTLKQGATYIVPFVATSDEPSPDYTGWQVYFMVKRNIDTGNAAAIIDEIISLDSVTGEASFTLTDEMTAAFEVGEYVYGAKLVDEDGNVAHTDVNTFFVEPVVYEGATA